MFDLKDFNVSKEQVTFDFKGYLNKLIGYWKLILVSLAITLYYAYHVNVREQLTYRLYNSIAMKEETNPLFTNNTSLIFNWGGTSDQVQNIVSTLQSRTHNEYVVDELNLCLNYIRQGEYHLQDVYGQTGYVFNFDKTAYQLLGHLIKIKILDENTYEIEVALENNQAQLYKYSDFTSKPYAFKKNVFKKKYSIGQPVSLPFLTGVLLRVNDDYNEKEFFLRFDNFDGTVQQYKSALRPEIDTRSASIINLTMSGSNVNKLEAYLNNTVKVLIKKQLDRKNKFANNTIAFIDSTLNAVDKQLKDNENELKDFNRKVNVLQLEGSAMINSELAGFEAEKEMHQRKIAYYNMLTSYINSKNNNFSNLPAPSVAGIEDPNVAVNVSKLIDLSNRKLDRAKLIKNSSLTKQMDNEMESLKAIIKENIIAAKSNIQYDINKAASKISQLQNSISKLPTDQQEYLKITRKYDLNTQLFTEFLAKRNEAEIVKASNVSDIQFIDSAKISDSSTIGTNKQMNYVLAIFLGFLIPVILIFFLHLFDKKILTIEDITTRTKTPLLGVIGKNDVNPLAVAEKPQSALSESFRSVRSSLQFLFSKSAPNEGKTIMLTSSVSGEGKTFCSINLATIYALSNKKTILVGLDLRKPKIFNDFVLKNETGAVHYLSNQKTLSEVIQKTHIENLDLILSGPIPPNPSELLISDKTIELIAELKKAYDYIIIDTPPIGLVSDAIHLSGEVDQTIYVFRQNYSKKEMVKILNSRLAKGELKNVSLILNDFVVKAKYGYSYDDYGYGYGYGSYSQGYYEVGEKSSKFANLIQMIKKYV